MRAWSRVLCLVLVVVAAGCTGSEPDSATTSVEEVRIGVLAPLSRADKAVGTDSVRGAQLAAKFLNGEEGQLSLAGIGPDGLTRLGRPKVTVIPGDTAGRADRGGSEAARLIAAERVVGLVGAYHTEVTEDAASRSERERVPFVSGDASADFLTENGFDWFFRTAPTDRVLAESAFSALGVVGGASVKTVGILSPTDRQGRVAAGLTRSLAAEGGYRVAAAATFGPTEQNLQEPVRRIQAGRPDAVFVVTSAADQTQRALRAFTQLGYNPPGLLVLGAGFFETPALQAAGADSQGLLAAAGWSREVAARNPAAKPVIELYEETYGSPMSEVAAGSFTAVLTLAKAMDDAGSIEPERVRTALLNLDIPGRDTIMPWNGVRFDDTHQNTGATAVVEQVDRDALRVVFPDELAREEARWPLASARTPGQQ